MKILKMPDKATEQFDRFVQQQLNKVVVDVSQADELANAMQFPVTVIPPAKQGAFHRFFGGRRKYFSLLLLLLFFSGIVTTITLFNNNSRKENSSSSGTGKTDNPATNNNAPNNLNTTTTLPENNNSGLNQVQNVTTIQQQNQGAVQPVTVKQINTGNIIDDKQQGKTDDQVKNNGNNTPVTVDNTVPNTQTGNDKTPGSAAQPDSARVIPKPAEKKQPEKKKDTIHVIW